MKRGKMILVFIIIIGGGFAAMMFFLGLRSDVPRKEPKARPKIVNITIAHPEPKSTTIKGLGQLTSAQPIDIYSEVDGIIMAGEIPFKPAQSFKRGDLLLKIDDRQIRLSINSTKSNFLSALAVVLAEIKSDHKDLYSIWNEYFYSINFEEKLPSIPESDNKRIQLLLSRLKLYDYYFAIRNLEVTLEKHYIYAPFDGSTVSTDMRAGSTARKGTRLGQIVNLEDMEVELPIIATDISWIKPGNKAELKSEELKSQWTGTVDRIGSSISSRTQTISVFIKLDNQNGFPIFDGLYLNVTIPGANIENAVTIPRSALYSGSQIYLIKEGLLELRDVKIARTENDTVILSGGLTEGDTVVTELMQGVVPGMPAQGRLIREN